MYIRSSLIVVLMVVNFMLISLHSADASVQTAEVPEITADAAILIDGESGQVLYEKNMHQKRPPASTTKIMTAIIALEGGILEQSVTISKSAAEVGESSINLRPNEKLSLEELIYGTLMRSGNDACVAIAEHIAGTEENFLKLMNRHAKLLGATNTNFCNTNGLPDDSHFSTAYDLAQIARYAMQNDMFRDIVRTKYKEIKDQQCGGRYLRNTNKLLWSYTGSDGIKTGTTDAAGCCLVGSARRDGRHLITVVLHSEDRYGDTIKLLNHGFNDFEEIVVLTKGEHFTTAHVENGYASNVPIISNSNLSILVSNADIGTFEQRVTLESNLSAPIRFHQKVGRLAVVVDGEEVGSVNLVTGSSINRLPLHLQIYKKLHKHI